MFQREKLRVDCELFDGIGFFVVVVVVVVVFDFLRADFIGADEIDLVLFVFLDFLFLTEGEAEADSDI